MDRDILIVVISQLPLVFYTVISGLSELRTKIRKTKSESESALGNALNEAGETLEGAWKEIRTLRNELQDERTARRKIEKELRRWTMYAALLTDQANKNNLPTIPFPPESQP